MIRVPEGAGRFAVVLLAFWAALNALCWSKAVPFGEGPDEVAHFAVVAFEAEHGRIPEVGVDDVGAEIHYKAGGFPYAYHTYSAQPGLTYILSAALVRSIPRLDRVTAARLPGIVYAALTVLFTAWGARALFPSSREAVILASVIVAAWPQLSFVFGYTNNDGYTIAIVTALLASWGTGVESRWAPREAAISGGLAGLALLGKPNGFPALAMTVVLVCITLRRGSFREIVKPLFIFGSAVAVVAGWWYVIAFRRYGFDLFAEAKASAMAAAIGGKRISAESLGWGFVETLYRTSEQLPHSWLELTLRSAVGMFSAMALPLPEGIYFAIAFFAFVAAAGWAAGRRPQLASSQRVTAALLVAMVVALGVLSLWRSYSNDFQPQGRYLLPAIYGFAVLASAGIVRAVERSGHGRLLLVAIVGAFLLMNVLALLLTVVPAYSETASAWMSSRAVLVVVSSLALVAAFGASFAALHSRAAPSQFVGIESGAAG